MSESYAFDAVIVGAGIAGLVSAVRLAEQGLRVGVLEKGEHEKYPCNSRMTGGAFHVAFRDVNDPENVLLDAMETRSRGFARPELVQAMAKDISVAVQWLKTKGVRFIKVGHEIHRQHTLAPPILLQGRTYWEGRGGDVLLRTLGGALKELGGTLLLGARAVRLSMKDGKCVGLEMEHKGARVPVQAGSVVLCDGGFQANHELMREFITAAPEKVKQRGAATGNGDGLQMARKAGAQLVGMDRFYGHLLAQDAMHNDDLWPFPIMDFVCTAGVVVDASARRFVDEGLGGVSMTNRIAGLADPLAATVVFDGAIWDGPGREFISPANPLLVTRGGTLHTAPDLAALAGQLGLPAAALAETVARYNAAVDAGETGRLDPPRTTATYRAHAIRTAPFHAIRLCAGITYTMGGIAIDGRSRVLNAVNQPIAGLYAAGCATGGLEGGEFIAYIGGLTKSSVTAFRAANEIAAGHAKN
ncbi:MAG: FAD-dependent oxidoreductase [Betaproteobacteria bacterium]|nr:FAD-dependent oxidoreductase [Betaproteobacteria bacterium]MBI2293848.1 FAD-dependent oxidoreductase [Betaproteobacteria bacterium]MBI3057133.1 FAD-dependent oxidoreductase [Betaproteobacteria bacterium]